MRPARTSQLAARRRVEDAEESRARAELAERSERADAARLARLRSGALSSEESLMRLRLAIESLAAGRWDWSSSTVWSPTMDALERAATAAATEAVAQLFASKLEEVHAQLQRARERREAEVAELGPRPDARDGGRADE
jgi:hypothetical protein